MTDPSPAEVVIDAVAVHRLTHLLQQDEMPVGALRERLLERYGDRTWSTLLVCPWCLSPYLAAGVVFARWRWPRTWDAVSRILVGSAVAGHLAQLADR